MATSCYPDTTNWGPRNWDNATSDELALKELAEAFAWRSLDILTAGALAFCPVSVRPARASCRTPYYLTPWDGATGLLHPYIGLDGQWYNDSGHSDFCQCDAKSIPLPGPIAEILSITIDGETLSPESYRVDSGYLLVRLDGGTWPLTQDMSALSGDLGSFVVTYYQGSAPDNLVEYAAGVLAREFLVSIEKGASKCRLPSKVTAVTRQGVTYDLELTMFDNGSTGINEVDMVISTYNPYKLKTQSRFVSVDSLRREPRYVSGPGTVTIPPETTPVNLIEDPENPGYYILTDTPGGLIEDPQNPGYYIPQES